MKRILLILTLCLTQTILHAHEAQAPKFEKAKFVEHMEQTICQKACFTNEETQTFLTLYREYKYKQRDLHREMCKVKYQKESNIDYEKAILEVCRINEELIKLKSCYYKKFLKALPAEKVYKALLAEENFHHELLKQRPQKK